MLGEFVVSYEANGGYGGGEGIWLGDDLESADSLLLLMGI
jgi:hypothetical protein